MLRRVAGVIPRVAGARHREEDHAQAVVDHLGAHFGEPERRWHFAQGALHVVRFGDRPIADASTYVTIGLSERVLEQPSGPVRQELMFSCYGSFDLDAIPLTLAHVAGQVALTGRALLEFGTWPRDEGLAPRQAAAFLFSAPIYFPPEVHVIETRPPTVLVWLIPILEDEAALVAEKGWGPLERRFTQQDPDLLDLDRKSVLAPES